VSNGYVRRFVVLSVVSSALLSATPAFATTIVEPSEPVDVGADLAPFTVSATGFPDGAIVYVEQCDGTPPTEPLWTPTLNCDLQSSPAGAIVSGGTATFAADDPNHAFRPFAGEGPGSLFNCLSPTDPDPGNGLPSSRACAIRVSTNNTAVTADQAFLGIRLADGSVDTPWEPASSVLATPSTGPDESKGSSGGDTQASDEDGAGSGGTGPTTTSDGERGVTLRAGSAATTGDGVNWMLVGAAIVLAMLGVASFLRTRARPARRD
jgi:hypothetical protein